MPAMTTCLQGRQLVRLSRRRRVAHHRRQQPHRLCMCVVCGGLCSGRGGSAGRRERYLEGWPQTIRIDPTKVRDMRQTTAAATVNPSNMSNIPPPRPRRRPPPASAARFDTPTPARGAPSLHVRVACMSPVTDVHVCGVGQFVYMVIWAHDIHSTTQAHTTYTHIDAHTHPPAAGRAPPPLLRTGAIALCHVGRGGGRQRDGRRRARGARGRCGYVCFCVGGVCGCVCEGEKEREREQGGVCMSECVVCVEKRDLCTSVVVGACAIPIVRCQTTQTANIPELHQRVLPLHQPEEDLCCGCVVLASGGGGGA